MVKPNLHQGHTSKQRPRMHSLLFLAFLPRWLRYIVYITGIAFFATYMTLLCLIAVQAHHLNQGQQTQHADAALILGYRTYQQENLNPCLTGRIDKGLSLANQGAVSVLVMTGGRDSKNNAIEAAVMTAYAKSKGFRGQIIQEAHSTSTMENLKLSTPMMKAASIKKIIIVSEPYHLWRVKKLATAANMVHDFDISYAAASSQCWTTWGMLSSGALREPLAIMHNFAKGYFRTSE